MDAELVMPDSHDGKKASSYCDEPISTDDVAEGTVSALGYDESYRRVFRTLGTICLSLALTSPLSALLLVASFQVNYGGYWGLTWGWIIPSIIFFPQTLAVAELCSSMPLNGAFYWWTAALAPPEWAHAAAFISGWTNVLALITTIASFSYAIGSTISLSVGLLATTWVPSDAQFMGLGMGVVCAWAALTLLRLERVQLVFYASVMIILITSIIFVIGLPVSYASQGLPFANASDVFGKYTNYSDWDVGVAVPMTWFSALWINSAWASPAYVVEGTRKGNRTAPKSIIWTYLSTAISGCLFCFIVAFCIPDMDAAAADPSGHPVLTLILNTWGAKSTFAWLIFSNIVGIMGGSGMMVAYACQIAAFARDGGLPYSHIFAKVDRRTSIPLYSVGILVSGGLLLLIFGLSTAASSIIYSLAVMAGLITYSLPIGLRIFARDRFVPGPFNLGRFSIHIYVWALASLVYCIVLESFPSSKNWTPGTFNYNWVVTLFVISASVVSYLILGKNFKGIDVLALDEWRRQARLARQ